MTPSAGGNTISSPRPEIGPSPRRASKLGRVQDRDTQIRLRRARRVRRGPLTVSCVADGPDAPARVAFAIGRNVGGAVDRNRARRRLRAVMGELAPRLGGRAWLVGADRTVLDADFDALRAEAAAAVTRLEAS